MSKVSGNHEDSLKKLEMNQKTIINFHCLFLLLVRFASCFCLAFSTTCDSIPAEPDAELQQQPTMQNIFPTLKCILHISALACTHP
jgi:hypothetical protein